MTILRHVSILCGFALFTTGVYGQLPWGKKQHEQEQKRPAILKTPKIDRKASELIADRVDVTKKKIVTGELEPVTFATQEELIEAENLLFPADELYQSNLPCSGRCMTFLLRTHDDPDAVLPLHDDDFTHVVFPFRHFRDQYRVSEISSVHRLHEQRIGIARWRGNGESVRATKFLSTESPVCPAARSKHNRFLGVSLFIHHIAGNRSAGLHQDLREKQLLSHLRLHRLSREPEIFLITTDFRFFIIPFLLLLKQRQRVAFRFYG